MMKKTIFFVILLMSLSVVFTQAKPCCKNKDSKGKVACKLNQSNIESNNDKIVSKDGLDIANSEGVQCSNSIQKKCNSKEDCPNFVSSPWWKFWAKKNECCNSKS